MQSSPSQGKTQQSAPPRAWVILADWCNTLAAITLFAFFLLGALLFSVEAITPSMGIWRLFRFLDITEGVLWAIACFIMVGVMAKTPEEYGGGAYGCFQFAILMVGGVFFALSGGVYPSGVTPGCVTNLTYLFSGDKCPMGPYSYAFAATPVYGITCFMIGAAMGLVGVLEAPKTQFISPFWGCLMFFLGAWTIGIFCSWGPILAGGFDTHQNDDGLDRGAPTMAWAGLWWIRMLGATFLFLGSAIFSLMNGSYCPWAARSEEEEALEV